MLNFCVFVFLFILLLGGFEFLIDSVKFINFLNLDFFFFFIFYFIRIIEFLVFNKNVEFECVFWYMRFFVFLINVFFFFK